MSKILVHIHSGPDLKNKATLGMLVAVSAIKDGHDVSLFLAADGVHLLNCIETGKVMLEGSADSLLNNDKVKELYLGISKKGRKNFRDVLKEESLNKKIN